MENEGLKFKYLITGSEGFVGSNLVPFVISNSRLVTRRKSNNSPDFFYVDNIMGSTNWNGAFNGIDVVIHLAGIAHSLNNYSDYRAVNVEGTLQLAKSAVNEGVRRFIFVSSLGVNGSFTIEKPFTSFDAANPHNSYAKSKYDAELGLKKIAVETGLEVVIVRPTLVYGPNAPGNFGLLTKFIKKLSFLPFGLVNNKRDFIAVQNLADLLIVCATHPEAAGHTFLASDGKAVSIKDFTNAIAEGLNKKVIQLPIPVPLMHFVAKWLGKSIIAEQLLGNLEVDSSSTNKILGWTPPFTMEQAMQFLKESTK